MRRLQEASFPTKGSICSKLYVNKEMFIKKIQLYLSHPVKQLEYSKMASNTDTNMSVTITITPTRRNTN